MRQKFVKYSLIVLLGALSMTVTAQNNSFDYWLAQGDLCIQKAQYRQALEYFKKADKIKDALIIKKRLVKAYELNGLYNEAIDIQRTIVENDKLNEIQLVKLANLHKSIGENSHAYKVFKILHLLNEKNPTYSYEMALLTSELNEQKNLFLKSYKIDSLHLKSIVKLATIYLKTGKYNTAKKFVDKGLNISSKHTALRFIKAKLLYQKENYKEAYDLFFDLLKSNQESIEINLYLGIICIQLEQLDKAEYYLDRAYQLNPNIADTNYYLGLLYQSLKDYDKSNAYLLQSIALKQPDVAKDYYRLGLNAQEQKQPQQALDFFKKAYDNDPTYYLALYEIAIMTDLLYEDKEMALNYYVKYLSKFKDKDSQYSEYVTKRIAKIGQDKFMKGQTN